MVKKRERTSRRVAERDAKKWVRDREKLAALSPGGSSERPIAVESASVIEVRAHALPCHQCNSEVRVGEHRVDRASKLRVVDITCTRCAAKRALWFRLVSNDPN